jgi:hypothetical protein
MSPVALAGIAAEVDGSMRGSGSTDRPAAVAAPAPAPVNATRWPL